VTSAHDVHSDFDDAVDAVAREMTRGEAPSMRAAVLARLDEPRHDGWHWFPVAAAAALVVILAAAVVTIASMDRAMAPDARLTITATPPATVAASEPLRPSAAPLGVEDARVAPVATSARQPDAPVSDDLPMSATDAAWLARALPSLAAQPPLAFDAIQPATVEIALLGMTPLEPAPLTMAPLDIKRAGAPR
jgi:hypothetical protein